jgi:hypothetical protein
VLEKQESVASDGSSLRGVEEVDATIVDAAPEPCNEASRNSWSDKIDVVIVEKADQDHVLPTLSREPDSEPIYVRFFPASTTHSYCDLES